MSIKSAQAIVAAFGDDLIVHNIDLEGCDTPREAAAYSVQKISDTINSKHILGGLVAHNSLKAISNKIHILGELLSENIYGPNDVNVDAELASKIISSSLPANVAHIALVSNWKDQSLLEMVRTIMPNKGVIFTCGEKTHLGYMSLTMEQVNSIPELSVAIQNEPAKNEPAKNEPAKNENMPEWIAKNEPAWIDEVDNKANDKEKVLQALNIILKKLEEKQEPKVADPVADPVLVKKLKVALGQEPEEEPEEPEFLEVMQEAEPPLPKNPAVIAAYEKMLAAKKAKEEQKKKDAEAQNPARQQEIRAKLAEILKQKKEKEEERKRLIALEAKQALEEQKQKVGNLFAIPKEGEFNGFKFNPAMDDKNDEETAQALENLKKIDAADPKNKKPKLDPIEEAKKLADELKQKKLLESLAKAKAEELDDF